MKLPEATTNRIIDFLLGGAANDGLVGYVRESQCKVTIVPSSFSNEQYEAIQAECEVEGVPVIFGTNRIEHNGDKVIVYADIVASAFYLLSRYDEFLHPEKRDIHGRFMAKDSFLGRNGLLMRPIIDEYRELLYKWLGQEVPKRQSKIYLTHDVDTITHYRRARGFLGGCARSLTKRNNWEKIINVLMSLRGIEYDPAYTFPYFTEEDRRIIDAHIIYFVKTARTNLKYDRPFYSLHSKDYAALMHLIEGNEIGYHSAYTSYDNPGQMVNHNAQLCAKAHRAHYLRVLPPDEMQRYAEAAITDDYSLAYAEAVGFRLGTTRPCPAINPATGEVIPLTLHPLTIMDGTLSEKHYLGLNREEATAICSKAIETVRKYDGDICLLWHNTTINDREYHKELYHEVLSML